MLEISSGKLARIIMLSRENGPDDRHLHDYIAGLNDDEKVSLVAVMWVGRGSFEAEEIEAAKRQAAAEATAPTEEYLMGDPALAEYLEDGMDALGIDVADAEDHM
ncbi:MAG: DUF3775 domain-containing protein [Pseudomonadota bacterium]